MRPVDARAASTSSDGACRMASWATTPAATPAHRLRAPAHAEVADAREVAGHRSGVHDGVLRLSSCPRATRSGIPSAEGCRSSNPAKGSTSPVPRRTEQELGVLGTPRPQDVRTPVGRVDAAREGRVDLLEGSTVLVVARGHLLVEAHQRCLVGRPHRYQLLARLSTLVEVGPDHQQRAEGHEEDRDGGPGEGEERGTHDEGRDEGQHRQVRPGRARSGAAGSSRRTSAGRRRTRGERMKAMSVLALEASGRPGHRDGDLGRSELRDVTVSQDAARHPQAADEHAVGGVLVEDLDLAHRR